MSFAIPDSVKRVCGQQGPFATVYLDSTRASEHGSDELTLRWKQLRSELVEQGAAGAAVAALDEAVGGHTDVGGVHGQVIVATAAGVQFDRPVPRPPARGQVRWSALPHLMPYLARRAPAIAHVRVVADRTGAQITGRTADETADAIPAYVDESVRGHRQYPVHETARDEWDERHFQNRVKNSWQENAKDVAGEIARTVSVVSAELVVLAGDPRARTLLRDALTDDLAPETAVVDVAAGSRADGASAEALEEAVREVLLRASWRRRRDVLAHLKNNVGRGELAVTGAEDVIDALRRSQADTVVLSDDPSSTWSAWTGPEPLQLATSEQQLREFGVEHRSQERFDAAVLRAAAGSNAQLVITPNGHDYLPGGIAALLRYTDPATPAP